jgi:hypothetical protein
MTVLPLAILNAHPNSHPTPPPSVFQFVGVVDHLSSESSTITARFHLLHWNLVDQTSCNSSALRQLTGESCLRLTLRAIEIGIGLTKSIWIESRCLDTITLRIRRPLTRTSSTSHHPIRCKELRPRIHTRPFLDNQRPLCCRKDNSTVSVYCSRCCILRPGRVNQRIAVGCALHALTADSVIIGCGCSGR